MQDCLLKTCSEIRLSSARCWNGLNKTARNCFDTLRTAKKNPALRRGFVLFVPELEYGFVSVMINELLLRDGNGIGVCDAADADLVEF